MKQTDKGYVEALGIKMWSPAKIDAFQNDILTWYDQHQRDLPWRQTKDPYKIWVSEVMLQQTQVVTVIPYYERFIGQYPDVSALALADEDDLLKIWEGLGYYSRVKNMHTAAKQVMEDWQGSFPDSRDGLLTLKGIGPYTSAAIASIAFNEKVAAVDGNVLRVFTRLFEIDADISKAKTKRLIEELVQDLMPVERPGDFNQAIMDLGASKSMPKVYETKDNPLLAYDQSYQKGSWQDYPVKKGKVKQKLEVYYALLLKNELGEVLLEKRPSSGLLADFWTFPLLSQEEFLSPGEKALVAPDQALPHLTDTDRDKLEESFLGTYQLDVQVKRQAIDRVEHLFSHRKWVIYAFEGVLEDGLTHSLQGKAEEWAWVKPTEFKDYAFPIPQQKLVDLYQDHGFI